MNVADLLYEDKIIISGEKTLAYFDGGERR